MNVGDAFFTMLWLDRGGEEANPVMDFFLDIGPWAFLVQKCVVVGVWLVVLLVHKNFRFARIGLYVSLAAYAILMLIHFGIIAMAVVPPKANDTERAPAVSEYHEHQAGTLHMVQGSDALDTQVLNRRVDPPTVE